MEILFETKNTRLLQCDIRNRYVLQIYKEEISFRACELIAFTRRVLAINMDLLLSSKTPDVEIINMPNCDRIFIFTLSDVLEIRELMNGAFAMLELNSIIHKEIVRKGALV